LGVLLFLCGQFQDIKIKPANKSFRGLNLVVYDQGGACFYVCLLWRLQEVHHVCNYIHMFEFCVLPHQEREE
jgi:hypothetical protein